jgi:hypothetical protein
LTLPEVVWEAFLGIHPTLGAFRPSPILDAQPVPAGGSV